MSKGNQIQIPSQFTGGPDSDSHIGRALKFLGTKTPKEITLAWQEARAAEWAWVRAASLNLADAVTLCKNMLAERLRYDPDVVGRAEAIASSQRLLDTALALLEAVPEEAERWRVLRERQEHKKSFDSAQTTLARMKAEQKSIAIEDVRHVATLRAQVIADEDSLRLEGKQRLAMRESADAALDSLRTTIVDALVSRLDVISKEAASAIGKDAEIYFEYRDLLDKDAPRFRKALMEAKVIQDLARNLGKPLDLVVAFQNHFPKKDQVARDLVESVILGDTIRLGSRDRNSGDSGILDLEL